MATIDSEIEDVNYVARLFVQSYYNTLIEERIKMNKYFLPNSQFSFSQGMQVCALKILYCRNQYQ